LLDKAVLGIYYPCMISYELMGGCVMVNTDIRWCRVHKWWHL